MTWKAQTGYDLDEEIEQHLDDRYRELLASGMTPDDAARIVRDEVRGWTPRRVRFDGVGADFRFAIRTLRRNAGFTAVVLLTLALGIGANVAIFSVVNAVLIRSLPYPDGDRLVVVWGNLHRPGFDEIPTSAGEYVDYRENSRAFDEIAAYDATGFNLTGSGEPERVEGAIVSANLFTALGALPEIGRTLRREDEQPGRNDVAVISHALWTRRFSRDRAIAGRTISIDGRAVQIVGVLRRGFRFPDETTELWKPILLDADALSANNRGSHGFTVIARLKPGLAIEQARGDLDRVASVFIPRFPSNYRAGFSTVVRRLQDEVVGDTSRALFVLFGAVGLVLLIACANVANLLLARAASRRKEMALRTALGASRMRLVRQLLTESVMVALAGGALGFMIASWGVDALVSSAPDSIPRLREVGVDAHVLTFTAIVSVATGVLFGLAPAVKASRLQPHDALKEGGRTATARGVGGPLLVVSEIALSIVLLVAAGLFMRSFARLQDVQPGFDADHLLTLRLSLPSSRYTTFEKGDVFFGDLFTRLRAASQIRGVAAINALPFSGFGGSRSFRIEGRTLTRPEDATEEQLRIVTDGYFRVMGIPMLKGREFAEDDSLRVRRVAVVNDAFARKHFPAGDALGKRVTFENDVPVWYEIVGISGNIKHRGLDAADRPELYIPYRQPLFANWTVRPMYVVVRTASDPIEATSSVRRELASVDPDQPVSDVKTMAERIDRSLTGRRFNATLLALFAALALTLAAVGIYGLIAYSVTERTHEIGVRIALGATRGAVVAMVLRQGMRMAVLGAAIGVVAALGMVRLIAGLLFGVNPADPATFTAIPLILIAAAFAACYVPARRATRVDPMLALRAE
ncbi:MAG TPA: ABC transporter permease [Vicinamibacterales bacterium]|nr:ABC transporter permease [Vicinamibacterales bacterium]